MTTASFVLSSGHSIPALAFGTGSRWKVDQSNRGQPNGILPEVVEGVKAAVLAGFRHFDAAEYYNNERSLGQGLKESGVPRHDLFITTKVASSLSNVPGAIQLQLDLLQVDYVDLYLIHTPKVIQHPITFKSAWESLEALVDQGLVRSIGVSNFSKEQFDQFYPEARIKPCVNQISLYPYIVDRPENTQTLEYCKEHNILIEAYEVVSPLARESEKGGPLDAVLASIAKDLKRKGMEATPAQLLLQWANAHGWVIVTTSSQPGRMLEYVKSLTTFTLEEDQIKRIDEAGLEGGRSGFGKYTSW